MTARERAMRALAKRDVALERVSTPAEIDAACPQRTAVDFISPEDRADAGEVLTFGFVSRDRAERFAAKLRAEGIEIVSIRPQPRAEVLALLRKISPALFNKDSDHG